MKKIFIVMSVAIIIALCSAPLFVKASPPGEIIGQAIVKIDGSQYQVDIWCDEPPLSLHTSYNSPNYWIVTNASYTIVFVNPVNSNQDKLCYTNNTNYMYIPTLQANQTLTTGQYTTYAYNNLDDYYNNIPDEFIPEEPSLMESIWDDFYDLYYDLFGFYPMPGSLFDLLRELSLGDRSENTQILYPTLTPTPTPTPSPTPIPVQTIFVPDGNGNTTIIYQYSDPTTGVITQSPYNPNIENNITVDCDCDGSGGSGGNIFGTNLQDPYTLTSSMLWADGFGVEISENPLTAANESQQTLAEAASEYADSVNVASNSFNILPVKWLTLVGLLGGILIIAGLIRTFLGG